MDGETWQAMVHRVAESDITERVAFTLCKKTSKICLEASAESKERQSPGFRSPVLLRSSTHFRSQGGGRGALRSHRDRCWRLS